LSAYVLRAWDDTIISAFLIFCVCGSSLSLAMLAEDIPFLAANHQACARIFARQNADAAPAAALWLTNVCVQICLVLIWLTASD
ncbi:amino acid permease, partial [Escherichia coli]|uniref:amino acid permease n=1 Tax=Escherichia coli TaxID=562 RepID=UPI0011154C8D